MSKVIVVPVRVQGAEAPEEICQALDLVNALEAADLIITGRGGGSMEDLWAFNEEEVARAISRSHIPVISAVGHEPDVTIADFVADQRASTPSNAAELAVPDQDDLRQALDHLAGPLGQGYGPCAPAPSGSAYPFTGQPISPVAPTGDSGKTLAVESSAATFHPWYGAAITVQSP